MQEGGRVEHVCNVTELLDRFANQLICPHRFGRVDLIIVDMSAEPNKLWGLVTLRQLGCQVPLVLINYQPDDSDLDTVNRLGTMALLGTPLDKDRLRWALRRAKVLPGALG